MLFAVVAVAEVLTVGAKDKAGVTWAAAVVDVEGATVGGTAITRAGAGTGVVVMVLVVVIVAAADIDTVEGMEVVPAVEEELAVGSEDEAGVTGAADVVDMDGATTAVTGAGVVVMVRVAPPKQ